MTKSRIMSVLETNPEAVAQLKGSALSPDIRATVSLYPVGKGTLVEIEAMGLPKAEGAQGPYGFHIHEGATCGLGGNGDAYSGAGGHYNPKNQPHPFHAGDLPVLFNNGGYGYMLTFTDRFKPRDIIGKTVILHKDPDDFRSQPAGNSGVRIACGVLMQL